MYFWIKSSNPVVFTVWSHTLSVHIITENASTVSNSDEVTERNRDIQKIPDLIIELYGHVSRNHRNRRILCHLPLNNILIILNTFNPSLLCPCPCSVFTIKRKTRQYLYMGICIHIQITVYIPILHKKNNWMGSFTSFPKRH